MKRAIGRESKSKNQRREEQAEDGGMTIGFSFYLHVLRRAAARRFSRPSRGPEGMLPQRNLGLDCTIFLIEPMNVLSNNTLLEEAQEE